MPDEHEAQYQKIIETTRYLQRNYRHIYPWMLTPYVFYHEATIRQHMADLARRGDLVRVGGFRARKGYTAPRSGCRPLPPPPWATTHYLN